jgi:hypothetical protein
MFVHCPKCKSVATIPIAYGKPGPEMMEAFKHGLMQLGGCIFEEYDRYCKSCGANWQTNMESDGSLHHRVVVEGLLKELESNLHNAYEQLEAEYMAEGRHRHNELFQNPNFGFFTVYHEAWATFVGRLQSLGSEIVIRDEKGYVLTMYTTSDASFVIIKHLGSLYHRLQELAISCYSLGSVTEKGSVDQIKKASLAVARARGTIEEDWQQMRRLAIGR